MILGAIEWYWDHFHRFRHCPLSYILCTAKKLTRLVHINKYVTVIKRYGKRLFSDISLMPCSLRKTSCLLIMLSTDSEEILYV